MRMRDRLPTELRTDRLVLRAPRQDDIGPLVAEANNWKVLEPTASLPFPYLREHAEGFVTRRTLHPDQRQFVLARREDDRLIGIISLYFDAEKPTELGYWLGQAHWGQGLAPEAVKALAEAAAEAGIDPLRARVLASNPGSLRVLEKTSFVVVEKTTSVVERHKGKPLLVLERRA